MGVRDYLQGATNGLTDWLNTPLDEPWLGNVFAGKVVPPPPGPSPVYPRPPPPSYAPNFAAADPERLPVDTNPPGYTAMSREAPPIPGRTTPNDVEVAAAQWRLAHLYDQGRTFASRQPGQPVRTPEDPPRFHDQHLSMTGSPFMAGLADAFLPHVPETRGDILMLGMAAPGGGKGRIASRAAREPPASMDFVGPPPAAVPAVEPKTLSSVFDYSRLDEVPKVPQFDLPRYDPPRGVPARVLDLISDPVLRQKMLETMQAGIAKGGPAWYNTEQLLEPFQSILGKEKGAAAYRKYLDYVAASSTRSEVGVNVRNASYYYNLWKNGLPMPEVGSPMPQPYGHMAQMQHQRNAIDVAGAGWDPLKTPKSSSFVEDLAGNYQPVAVDAHATKLPPMLKQDPRWLAGSIKPKEGGPTINPRQMFERGELSMDDALKRPVLWTGEPNANEYGALENYWQGLSQEMGLRPAQGQGSGWVGGGHITGLKSDANIPFLRFVDDRLHITAERLGVPPETVLKDFIKGKTTLLGLGGAAIGFAALPPDQQKALVERAGSPDPGGA